MDKATTHRKDLRWVRILVKNSCYRKPSSINMLAGARSYELQIWWEIQPKVVGVYPKVYRPKGSWTKPSEEDEVDSRAKERVSEAFGKMLHTAQEWQWVESQKMRQELCGSAGGMIQPLKCFGTPKVGPKICCVSQNNLGTKEIEAGEIRGREWASHFGLQSGIDEAHNVSPRQDFRMGQSPKINRKHNGSSSVKKAVDYQMTNCKKRSDEEEKINTASPIFTKPHKPVISGADDEGDQKKRSSANLGQTKGITSKGDTSNKARRTSREERGSQTEGKEGSPHESDQNLNPGKATRDAPLNVVSNIGGDEGAYCGGEKSLNPIGGDEGVSCEARRNSICSEESSSAPKREDEGDDNSQAEKAVDSEAEGARKLAGMWSRSGCEARRSTPVHQENEGVRSGKASLVRGLATCVGPDLVVGRKHGMELGLGRPSFMDPGPKPNLTFFSHALGFDGCTCSKAMEMVDGLRKEVQSRPPLQLKHNCSCSVSTEENGAHNWEADVNREDHCQDNESSKINRYDDNLYAQSNTAIISVFGRPLLAGDTSGLGGSNGEDNVEPLRVVAADGREWGVEFSAMPDEEGGSYAAVCQRMTDSQHDALGHWNYESWEKSCLAKFSNFLGFPIKGFEKEITKLLKNLVNAQNFGKEKECLSMSKSERELRKLQWTINYNGNKTSREGGRDRGNLLLKLK